VEHLDVLVVGAGISGVAAGHYLKTKCPWATFAIFEARQQMGGTWDLFSYPGLRSDSDMFTLGYSFRPWDGEKSIADGSDILDYLHRVVEDEGLGGSIRYCRRVVAADWSTPDACWRVKVERTDTGEREEVTANFVFGCTGYYRYDRGYLPPFEGLDRFPGPIIHPQAWPDDLDFAGRRVVVIGSGATAVTLVPALAAKADHVVMLQRSPTYIATLPAVDPIANAIRRLLPDPPAGAAVRWFKALTTQASYQISRRWPDAVKRILRHQVKRQLPPGYDVDTHFKPRYNPWDQRLCVVPNGDLFRSIRKGKVSVVTDCIKTFTEKGLALESGSELEADIIVTATGLDLLFMGGINVTIDGRAVDVSDRLTYKGMMLEGVPNMALAVGYTNASWTLKCELTCDYVCRLLEHMRRTGSRQCTPINNDASVSPEPLLGLTSGYVLRSADRFPKQGSRFPWRVYQSYLQDYRAMKLSGVEDSVMQFSNPVPARELQAAG
jgi:monooxygenase